MQTKQIETAVSEVQFTSDKDCDISAVYQNGLLNISVGERVGEGDYDGKLRFLFENMPVEIPVIIEVSNGKTGENRIKNGDFEHGRSYWFGPKEKSKFNISNGIGVNKSAGLKLTGKVFCGQSVVTIKVRNGEDYGIYYDIMGTGSVGVAYQILNADKKVIYPPMLKAETLAAKGNPNQWRRINQVLHISRPGACYMRFFMLSNYAEKNPEAEIYVDNFSLVRLDGRMTMAKVLWQGTFSKPKSNINIDGDINDWQDVIPMVVYTKDRVDWPREKSRVPWNSPADLSAQCRVMKDNENLYFSFEITMKKFTGD